jgi:hypothetical protein
MMACRLLAAALDDTPAVARANRTRVARATAIAATRVLVADDAVWQRGLDVIQNVVSLHGLHVNFSFHCGYVDPAQRGAVLRHPDLVGNRNDIPADLDAVQVIAAATQYAGQDNLNLTHSAGWCPLLAAALVDAPTVVGANQAKHVLPDAIEAIRVLVGDDAVWQHGLHAIQIFVNCRALPVQFDHANGHVDAGQQEAVLGQLDFVGGNQHVFAVTAAATRYSQTYARTHPVFAIICS